jgi:hypothetical protein
VEYSVWTLFLQLTMDHGPRTAPGYSLQTGLPRPKTRLAWFGKFDQYSQAKVKLRGLRLPAEFPPNAAADPRIQAQHAAGRTPCA